jgi:probable HAF family extracellular repeat protein
MENAAADYGLKTASVKGFAIPNGPSTVGTLPGDVSSEGDGINDKGQVVGCSSDVDGNSRAYLWQDGVMTDLNALIPADSPLFLLCGSGTINSRGQIAGFALQTSSGEIHGFLATPVYAKEAATPAVQGKTKGARSVAIPENVRSLLRRRPGHPYRIPTP